MSGHSRFKDDFNVLKAMYGRSMVDLEALLHNHSSNDEGFNEMSRLNTLMLSYLYPNQYKDLTYHIEDDPELTSAKSKNEQQTWDGEPDLNSLDVE